MEKDQIATLNDLQQVERKILSALDQLELKITTQATSKEWLTLKEVQEIFTIKSRNTVMKLYRGCGNKVGGKWLFLHAKILEQNKSTQVRIQFKDKDCN